MSAASRRKGVTGENEAAKVWKAHGCDCRLLGGQGDRLIVCGPHGPTLHGEYKRQERIQLWQWIEQAEAEAPSIAIPSVTFRPSHRPWYTVLRTEHLAPLLAELGELRPACAGLLSVTEELAAPVEHGEPEWPQIVAARRALRT